MHTKNIVASDQILCIVLYLSVHQTLTHQLVFQGLAFVQMKLNEFIETLFREEEDSSLSPERISSISSALLRAPITSTLRVNTLRITIEEGISLLRDHLSSSFSLRQCPEIPELLLIDGIRNCCESTAGLEVQVSPDAGKAFLRGADIYAVQSYYVDTINTIFLLLGWCGCC